MYTALYRKFRPRTFDEVRGQDAIVTTLRNQVISNRVAHAYLFCGVRGTGKTTLAKILAKAVNCENPQNGNPCNECPTCKTIAKAQSFNVVEIDAASNNGVENIRQICDDIKYPPTDCKYKVYIIDEVHMLSTGAFNALLKTLEEPPAYVKFILATTEIHKVPATINSRCQRFEFKRIGPETISEQLKSLLIKEGILANQKAIDLIAKKADGSMRDALSILDQCIAYYPNDLSFENVLNLLGAADTEILSAFFKNIILKNVSELMRLTEELFLSGKELLQFTSDLTWYIRDLMLFASAGTIDIDISEDNKHLLEEDSKLTSIDKLIYLINYLSDLQSKIKANQNKRIVFETAIIVLCQKPITDIDRLKTVKGIKKIDCFGNICDASKETIMPLMDFNSFYQYFVSL